MRGALLACMLGGALGSAACLLELDFEIACGDGYVDVMAGEECDPGHPEGFDRLCGGQGGGCHPVTCQQECCGDLVINGDEECDGPELGLVGPGGDPAGGDSCGGLLLPGTSIPYSSGSARCTSDCSFDVRDCSLCGNGQVERIPFTYNDGSVLPAEICDGELIPDEHHSSVCAPLCGQPSDAAIECNLTCEGCRLLVAQTPLDCCFRAGTPRAGLPYPCCCELDPRGCELTITPSGEVAPVCPSPAQDESS